MAERCAESGKVMYTLADAEYARRRLHRRTDQPLDVFHCRACGCWHVGHRPIGTTRAGARRQPRRVKRAHLTRASLLRLVLVDDG